MKKFLLPLLGAVVIIPILVLIGGFAWLNLQSGPVEASNTQEVRFVIPKGQATSVIGQRLKEEGLINNYYAFRWIARQKGYQSQFQAGSFELSPSMTTEQIAQALTIGSEDMWVTIPEGLRREEYPALLAGYVEFDEQEFLTLTEGLEGQLYPDTYLFPEAATTEFIVNYLTNTFETKTKDLQAQAKRQGQDWEEAVVLASIVQREAKTPEQMKLVAGILQNRLEIGMALEVDATLQYIKGFNARTGRWWTPPLAVDKELESPFNTYKYPGLPPTPIANPGLDALTAVINPTENDNLFYLHAPDGRMYYGKTYQEHLVNIERYLR